MAERLYLLLGSNVGRRERYLERARWAIKDWAKTRVRRTSSIWETLPVGSIAQRNFLNQVIEADSDLAPMALLIWAKKTEIELGRRARMDQGPREIDIDILAYGSMVVRHPFLQIPHSLLAKRPFALIPFRELRPNWQDPVSGRSMASLTRPMASWLEAGQIKLWGAA